MATKTKKDDLLSSAVKKAGKAPASKGKESLPTKKVSKDVEKELVDLIPLATIGKELDPLVSQYKASVGQMLLDVWLDEMWTTKRVPSNFEVPIPKYDDSGKATLMKDMDTTFQVKFRSDGLSKVVPDADELPEGVSVEDKLMEALTSDQVSLSQINAQKILDVENGDIQVVNQLFFVDTLDNLYHSPDPLKSGAVTKLLEYFRAVAAKKGDTTVRVPIVSDEETNSVVVTKQVVKVKEGFFERACTYCESREQLGKLIRFIKPTLQFGSFEFGVSDKKSDRVHRLSDTMTRFLSVEE